METKTGRFEGIESYEYKMPSKGNYDDEDIDSDDVCDVNLLPPLPPL